MVPAGADLVDPDGCLENECVDDRPQDHDGHGTAIAGVLAAVRDNGEGIVGIAPRAMIMPIRVYSGEAFHPELVGPAIRFATDHGADVINMSLTMPAFPVEVEETVPVDLVFPRYLKELNRAVDYAWSRGVVMVAAAGNAWPHSTFVHPGPPHIGISKPFCGAPAFNPKVICVGAVDRNDVHAYYSDYDLTQRMTHVVGPSGGDVSEGPVPRAVIPCEDRIVTTWLPGGVRHCPGDLPEGYNTQSGTSEATPRVAGTAAAADLYVVDRDGSTLTQLTDTPHVNEMDVAGPRRRHGD